MRIVSFIATSALMLGCGSGEALAATKPLQPGQVVTLTGGVKCKVLGSIVGDVGDIGEHTLRGVTLRSTNALLEVLDQLKTSDPAAYSSVVNAFNDVPSAQREVITEDLGLQIGKSEIAVSAPAINSYRLKKGMGQFEELNLRQLDKVYAPAQ